MTFAIVVVTALILAPGVGAALALARPGEIALATRVALVFGLGYAVVAATATFLAVAHVLSRPSFIAALLVVTGTLWGLAVLRASPRTHATALITQAREEPYALAVGLVLLIAAGAARALYPPGISLAIRSSWRYWADGLEIADAGRIPAQTQQWGIEFPTTVSKVVLNGFEAGVSYAVGPDPLEPMQAILVVTTIGLVAALFALGRELGLGVFAPLVPALSVLVPDRLPLSHELSRDLKWYTAEDMGRMVAFCALLVGIYAVRRPDRRLPAVVTGVLLAAAALTHLVPALIAGVLLLFYGLAVLLRERAGIRRLAPVALASAGVFVLCYAGTLGLSGGDLGFQAAEGRSFAAFPSDVDPTRSFSRGELVPPIEKEGHFLISPSSILSRYGAQAAGRPDHPALGLALLAALAAATIWLVLVERRMIPLAAMAWGLFATILAVSFLFSFRYDTRVPADFGARRLSGYVVLLPALLIPALLQALARRLLRPRPAAQAVLALLVGTVAIVLAVGRIPNDRSLAPADAGIAVAERVSDVIPCGSRMLANARTAGFWEATTGRRAVTEGHAPFLRPGVLARVLPVLLGANEFFDDPNANREFLERERIEYLVLVKPNVWIGTAGPRRPEARDANAVAALPGVRPVLRSRRVSIFAVGPSTHEGKPPRRCPL